MLESPPKMHQLLLFALVAALTVGTAHAQEIPGRVQVKAYVGEGYVRGSEGTYGKGAEQGGSIEFRPFSRIGFMLDVNRLNHSGSIVNPGGANEWWDIIGTAVHSSGSLVYHFSGVRFEPYVFGGAGAVRVSRTIYIKSDFIISNPSRLCLSGCEPRPIPTRFDQRTFKGTNAAAQIGGGIRVPLVWRLSFQPEFRFVQSSDIRLAHAVFALAYTH